jgi:hypothetical protein
MVCYVHLCCAVLCFCYNMMCCCFAVLCCAVFITGPAAHQRASCGSQDVPAGVDGSTQPPAPSDRQAYAAEKAGSCQGRSHKKYVLVCCCCASMYMVNSCQRQGYQGDHIADVMVQGCCRASDSALLLHTFPLRRGMIMHRLAPS